MRSDAEFDTCVPRQHRTSLQPLRSCNLGACAREKNLIVTRRKNKHVRAACVHVPGKRTCTTATTGTLFLGKNKQLSRVGLNLAWASPSSTPHSENAAPFRHNSTSQALLEISRWWPRPWPRQQSKAETKEAQTKKDSPIEISFVSWRTCRSSSTIIGRTLWMTSW